MGDRELAGRHAVVTGATRGIGAAVARELARRGADVSLVGRDQAALDERAGMVAGECGVRTAAVRCDVAVEAEVDEAFRAATGRLGPVYALVNSAGVAASSRFLETPREEWDRLLAVNLTGTYLCMRRALGPMLEAGEGRIVNVASTAGLRGGSRIAAYSASKHGVIGLTRSVAAEVAKHGVTVNAVCPGYTDTGMAAAAIRNLVTSGRTEEEARRMIEGTNPLGRLIRPEEVADTVAWLCSPGAAAITGQAIVVA